MIDWVEAKTAQLIACARRSAWSREIFADADHFISQGYVTDVALMIACQYWLSDGVTRWQPGEVKRCLTLNAC